MMNNRDQIQNEEHEKLHEKNRLGRIRQYIADNLTTNLHAAAISKKFELSVSSLQHIFKKHQKQTYQHYLEDIRMEKAFILITKERKRIKEVMYATGYKNRATFNNAFKKKFKHPPSYFQK